MSDEEAPPSPSGSSDSVPPGSASEGHERASHKDSRRRRLEGVIPEIVRRAVELGVEKAQEAPDNLKSFVNDLKVPKEIAHYLLGQIDETKNGLFRVVAKEMRDFLEHTNFSGEVQKLLTTVQFEVNTTIRFTPNDGRSKSSKKSDPNDRDRERDDEGDPNSSDSDDAANARDSEDGESGERRPTPLPKPEVKTAVHIRRDEQHDGGRRPRRDRAT